MSTTTPIIPGFHPDPSVCRVGDDFFLVNSSFEYLPGVPVFHSRNLVDWHQIGHVLHSPEHLTLPGAHGSGGIFAPTIRHRDGLFWMATTTINRVQDGQLICHAERAEGPWSTARLRRGHLGHRSGSVLGSRRYLLVELDGWRDQAGERQPRHGRTPQRTALLWPGTGLANPEGPHVYKRGKFYYLLLAEGGTERGHAVTIARSTSLEGPWEPCPHNPVLSHRSTTEVVQETGHSDLVELADGSWALVFLGVRPKGPTLGFHLLGRETFVWAKPAMVAVTIDRKTVTMPVAKLAVYQFHRSLLFSIVEYDWVVRLQSLAISEAPSAEVAFEVNEVFNAHSVGTSQSSDETIRTTHAMALKMAFERPEAPASCGAGAATVIPLDIRRPSVRRSAR